MSYRRPKLLTRIAVIGFSLSVLSTPALAATKSSTKSTTKSNGKSSSRSAAKCDRNYEKCVPVASDVDCAGGKGNGPKYLSSPKKVLGKDIYRLDNDHDKIACEKK